MLTPEECDATGKFLPYFGNHHKQLPGSDGRRGGAVSFKRHLDKPLSAALWEDITERLCASRVLVHRENDLQWTLGWPGSTCIISLNGDGAVDDIEWFP